MRCKTCRVMIIALLLLHSSCVGETDPRECMSPIKLSNVNHDEPIRVVHSTNVAVHLLLPQSRAASGTDRALITLHNAAQDGFFRTRQIFQGTRHEVCYRVEPGAPPSVIPCP